MERGPPNAIVIADQTSTDDWNWIMQNPLVVMSNALISQLFNEQIKDPFTTYVVAVLLSDHHLNDLVMLCFLSVHISMQVHADAA